jgi:GT2 family glycosyltransferase
MTTVGYRSLLVRAKRRVKLRTRTRAAIRRAAAGPPAKRLKRVYRRWRDIDLLVKSPLFDLEWYMLQAGPMNDDRKAAARHYVLTGHTHGLSPHPLFDPDFYISQLPGRPAGRPLFLYYVSRSRSGKISPHPLFDSRAYARANPQAVRHPHGLLGHYQSVGAGRGARPNDWYAPDPAAEPQGLVDWIRARRIEWQQRQDVAQQSVPEMSAEASQRFLTEFGESARGTSEASGGPTEATVVLLVGADLNLLSESAASVAAQTISTWELLVLHESDAEAVAAALGPLARDSRVRMVTQHASGRAAALNDGIGLAQGTYLAWLYGGDMWEPGHLHRAMAAVRATGSNAAHAVVRVRNSNEPGAPATTSYGESRTYYLAFPATRERLAAGMRVELSAVVVARDLAVQIGGFDESMPAADYDFILRVARDTELAFVPIVGVTRDDKRRASDVPPCHRLHESTLDHRTVTSWYDVAVNRHTIDWASLGSRRQRRNTVSVVVPTHDDWAMTTRAVESVAHAAAPEAWNVEILVVDNGCDAATSAVLNSLPFRFDGVKIISNAVNQGFALGNNRALEHATGSIVVFLNNDTDVRPRWLQPLVTALDADDVLAAQSLLIYPTGSIQSAGIAFPSCGGIPHALLQGFPVEDAAGLASAELSAATGAALAVRYTDLIALRGFDPLFRNGMEDVDFGLRLRRMRPGRIALCPDSVVVHHESKSTGRFLHKRLNRRLLLDRWGADMPRDDRTLWRMAGFDVVRYELRENPREGRRLAIPMPVLARKRAASVVEGFPSLRWAIKNPAPANARAQRWGDTHFANRLAAALRRLGQQVVIDNRPEFYRPTGMLDDVVLVLRGLAPYEANYGQVSVCWLISHPDMFSRAEAESFDRVFAASESWSAEMSKRWRIRIDPLLQATEPSEYYPDLARPDTGHPVLFIGNSRGQLRPLVRAAVERGLPLSVYGPEWKGLIPDEYVKARSFPFDQAGAAYRAAGVVLNDHWEDMRNNGFLSNRLFDAVASGARVITDEVVGLGDLFGRSVQIARDADELARLAGAADLDAIFGDDQERRKVAAQVHAEHSFDVRARQLLESVLEVDNVRST